MKLKAYAKLNLALDITGKRPDGYHELDTIMQSISLFDTVTIEKADIISVHMNKDVAPEKNNTAYKAADLFCKHTGIIGAAISIDKRIPSMAGLGGSSADAAAVLIGLNELFDTGLTHSTLAHMGKQIGADVPFCMTGGTARAKGIGEKLQQLQLAKPLYFVVVKPHQGVSTAKAFSAYKPSSKISIESVVFALQKGDIELFNKYSGNALGMASLSIAPDIMKAASALRPFGKAFMSGSGSSMFCVLETKEQAEKAVQSISGDFELCGAFHTKHTGIEIIGENE